MGLPGDQGNSRPCHAFMKLDLAEVEGEISLRSSRPCFLPMLLPEGTAVGKDFS